MNSALPKWGEVGPSTEAQTIACLVQPSVVDRLIESFPAWTPFACSMMSWRLRAHVAYRPSKKDDSSSTKTIGLTGTLAV